MPKKMEDERIRSELMQSMTKKLEKKPELLNESTGTEMCCVFRVPQSLSDINQEAYLPPEVRRVSRVPHSLADINQKAYLPLIVSIGPYHNGRDQLKAIQERKWRYLYVLLSRCAALTLDDLLQIVLSMEEEIRNSYSEAIKLDKRALVELMLLDGCFLIELFWRANKVVRPEDNDPIFAIPWFLPYVVRDLLRLENQIPFLLLDKLYDSVRWSAPGSAPSIMELALKFFNRALGRKEKVIEKSYGLKGVKHLLDLYCLSLMPPIKNMNAAGGALVSEQVCYGFGQLCFTVGESEPEDKREGFYSAMKLHQAGIKVQMRETESFLDIKFVNGVLQVPRFRIDDFTSSVLLNAIAFEQSYIYRYDCFTHYISFMGRLINTPEDVGFLRDRGIIENYLGNDGEVVQFFSAVIKGVVIDMRKGYLKDVLQAIETYRGRKKAKLHASWAELLNKYFGSPWALASFLGAFTALLLTAIQTYYAVNPKK